MSEISPPPAACGCLGRNPLGLKGVSEVKGGKFLARIRANGDMFNLGLHDDPNVAHAAYAARATILHGKFARMV
jgi:hypothetical protein